MCYEQSFTQRNSGSSQQEKNLYYFLLLLAHMFLFYLSFVPSPLQRWFEEIAILQVPTKINRLHPVWWSCFRFSSDKQHNHNLTPGKWSKTQTRFNRVLKSGSLSDVAQADLTQTSHTLLHKRKPYEYVWRAFVLARKKTHTVADLNLMATSILIPRQSLHTWQNHNFPPDSTQTVQTAAAIWQ